MGRRVSRNAASRYCSAIAHLLMPALVAAAFIIPARLLGGTSPMIEKSSRTCGFVTFSPIQVATAFWRSDGSKCASTCSRLSHINCMPSSKVCAKGAAALGSLAVVAVWDESVGRAASSGLLFSPSEVFLDGVHASRRARITIRDMAASIAQFATVASLGGALPDKRRFLIDEDSQEWQSWSCKEWMVKGLLPARRADCLLIAKLQRGLG